MTARDRLQHDRLCPRRGHEAAASWVWELKSVNGKSLDLRLRLPPGLDALEPPLRASLAQRCRAAPSSATLTVTARRRRRRRARQSRGAGADLVAAANELAGEVEAAPPRARRAARRCAAWSRAAKSETEDEAARERRHAALLGSWAKALDGLVATRRGEGARLDPGAARRSSPRSRAWSPRPRTAPRRSRRRCGRGCASWSAALLDASPALPEERLAQEMALLVARADIREELDRLRAHLVAARELLAEGDAVGRRFDFLCQELNREANTLCSKSADIELTRIGLALKAAIEQFREQVQNIE